MKHLDVLSQRILAVSLSLMGLILCTTLFVATIGPANASNTPEQNESYLSIPGDGGNGRIMMDYTSVHVPSQDKTYYEVMVWDTETGASKLYYYSYSDKAFKPYDSNVQLPANPLD